MSKVASPALKAVLITLVVSCLLLVVTAIQQALSGRYLPLLFAAVLWAPLAWGLWHLHPLARKVALALLWLLIVILPIGVINPFAAMDGAISLDTPLWQLAVPLFGTVAAALFAVHILIKHKAAFSK
jgi:hypothetical protein